MSDIMDEFEFKPLTQGLGFHKKKDLEEPKRPIVPETTTFRELSSPLPRPEHSMPKLPATPPPSSSNFPSTTVDEILKTLQQKKRPEFLGETKKTKIDTSPEPDTFKPTTWDFSAFVLDAMLVIAMNLLCLIILLLNTRVELFANLFNPDSNKMIYVSLVALFLTTSWIYLVATRVFLGCTAGEWVFDQRVGLPEETGSAAYSAKAVLRSTFVVLSGFLLFPFVSLLTNKDILGRWLGFELMKKI